MKLIVSIFTAGAECACPNTILPHRDSHRSQRECLKVACARGRMIIPLTIDDLQLKLR